MIVAGARSKQIWQCLVSEEDFRQLPEPFKDLFNAKLIAAMGDHLGRAYPGFDRAAFVKRATAGLEPLEMKERAAHIQAALDPLLPSDFRAACTVMLASLSPKTEEDWQAEDIHELGICGWAVMPMAEIVAARGLDDFEHAMGVLSEMTKRFTSEFAVRPFFISDPDRALGIARDWAVSDNYHVRRLASEGSRPRLPWGLRLQSYVADPAPLIPMLKTLRDDPSEYVRRSVANSLNDIAKDHPDLIAETAGAWLKDAPKDRIRLIKHACRTLIKAGHKPTLTALGYGPPMVEAELTLNTRDVSMGGAISFEAEISSRAAGAQPLIVDYVIHHRKANGTTSPKTFKWKVLELAASEAITLRKSHLIKPITTRVYHAGTHYVELQINGVSFGRSCFELTIP